MKNPSHPNEPSIHFRDPWRSALLVATLLFGAVSCKSEAPTNPADVDFHTGSE
jgi:hypothetical protein